MEVVAFVFGTMGFIFGLTATEKVSKLEKKLKSAGVISED